MSCFQTRDYLIIFDQISLTIETSQVSGGSVEQDLQVEEYIIYSINILLSKISRWPKRRLPLSQNKHFAIPNSGEVFQLVFNNIKVLFNKGMKNS